LFECDPVLRLAALLPDDQLAGGRLAERLRLANAERDRIVAALAPTPVLKSWMSPAGDPPRGLSGPSRAFRDRAKLAWAASPRTRHDHAVARR
jgi:hypothetical protein